LTGHILPVRPPSGRILTALLFPSKLLEFFGGANELYRAIIEQNAAAAGFVVIESKQIRSAMLIPSDFGLE